MKTLNHITIIKSTFTYSAASRHYNLGIEFGLTVMMKMIVMILMSSVGMS